MVCVLRVPSSMVCHSAVCGAPTCGIDCVRFGCRSEGGAHLHRQIQDLKLHHSGLHHAKGVNITPVVLMYHYMVGKTTVYRIGKTTVVQCPYIPRTTSRYGALEVPSDLLRS